MVWQIEGFDWHGAINLLDLVERRCVFERTGAGGGILLVMPIMVVGLLPDVEGKCHRQCSPGLLAALDESVRARFWDARAISHPAEFTLRRNELEKLRTIETSDAEGVAGNIYQLEVDCAKEISEDPSDYLQPSPRRWSSGTSTERNDKLNETGTRFRPRGRRPSGWITSRLSLMVSASLPISSTSCSEPRRRSACTGSTGTNRWELCSGWRGASTGLCCTNQLMAGLAPSPDRLIPRLP